LLLQLHLRAAFFAFLDFRDYRASAQVSTRHARLRAFVYSLSILTAGRALHVPAEFIAHTGQQFFRKSVILP
jgi:hypothetical protein